MTTRRAAWSICVNESPNDARENISSLSLSFRSMLDKSASSLRGREKRSMVISRREERRKYQDIIANISFRYASSRNFSLGDGGVDTSDTRDGFPRSCSADENNLAGLRHLRRVHIGTGKQHPRTSTPSAIGSSGRTKLSGIKHGSSSFIIWMVFVKKIAIAMPSKSLSLPSRACSCSRRIDTVSTTCTCCTLCDTNHPRFVWMSLPMNRSCRSAMKFELRTITPPFSQVGPFVWNGCSSLENVFY